MQQKIVEAHVVILALDSDWPRKDLNRKAVRNLIPTLDTAAEVLPGKESCEAGGQLRFIEPGATACLVCSGTLDLSEGNPEALSPQERLLSRRAGYIRGLDDTPTPSVLDLNGVISYLALSHLRRMVFGEPLENMDYVLYDRQACRLLAAAMPKPDSNCPVCGSLGELGAGDDESSLDSNSANATTGAVHFEQGQELNEKPWTNDGTSPRTEVPSDNNQGMKGM